MIISEIFQSVQGEGLLTGTPSVFVRTSGCNLRCWFCDTPYTSWRAEGRSLGVDEMIARVRRFDVRHVVLTGGEPLLQAESVQLCETLHAEGLHITVETAGTCFLHVACDLMSISPKLAGSTPSTEQAGWWRERHEQRRHAPDVVRRLIAEHPYQIKFVIDRPDDLEEVAAYLGEVHQIDRHRVWLMPQGTEPRGLQQIASWLQDYCAENGFRFCPRRQIEWFGLARAT